MIHADDSGMLAGQLPTERRFQIVAPGRIGADQPFIGPQPENAGTVIGVHGAGVGRQGQAAGCGYGALVFAVAAQIDARLQGGRFGA